MRDSFSLVDRIILGGVLAIILGRVLNNGDKLRELLDRPVYTNIIQRVECNRIHVGDMPDFKMPAQPYMTNFFNYSSNMVYCKGVPVTNYVDQADTARAILDRLNEREGN